MPNPKETDCPFAGILSNAGKKCPPIFYKDCIVKYKAENCLRRKL